VSTLNEVCEAIARRVGTSYEKIDARAYPAPGSMTLPGFFLEVASFPYRTTARKTDYQLRGTILVADAITAEASRQLRDLIERDAIPAAIEGVDRTLGGLVDQVTVFDVQEMTQDEYQAVGAWGALLTIQIMGRTS